MRMDRIDTLRRCVWLTDNRKMGGLADEQIDTKRRYDGFLTYRYIRIGRLEMARLSVRLDDEQRRRLDMVVETRGAPISDVVRRLIDDAYEEIMLERRRAAMEIEDVPDRRRCRGSWRRRMSRAVSGIENFQLRIGNWGLCGG